MTSEQAPHAGSAWPGWPTSARQFRPTLEDHRAWGEKAYELARGHERDHGLKHEDTIGLYKEAATNLVNVVVETERHGDVDPLTMFKVADSLAKQAEATNDSYLSRIATRDLRKAAELLMGEGHVVEALASELTAVSPPGAVAGLDGVPETLDPELVSDTAEHAIEALTDEHELPPAAGVPPASIAA